MLLLLSVLLLKIVLICGYNYEANYIEVPLDHYSFGKETFKMKYLVNNDYWDSESGPIFIYTGNQAAIETFANNTGFMWDIAEEFKARLVFAEHRYYGESLPFGEDSIKNENLRHLTSEQAIADYADLVNYFQGGRIIPQYPVIAFGGSYGGMLATYFRLKYPHLVDGAIVSSSPMQLFPGMTPCENYYIIATNNFKRSGGNCEKNIRKSWPILRTHLVPSNYTKLSNQWNLCDVITLEAEVDAIITFIKGVYETLAASNYPYETDYSRALPAEPVNYICGFLGGDNMNDAEIIEAIGKVLDTFVNYGDTTNCINYKAGISGGSHATGAWGYQRCTEIVLPTCTTGTGDMFEPSPWNLTAFSAKCQETYGEPSYPDKGRIMFGGGRLHAASNIVFSNGQLDPWAAGGILKDINRSVKAVVIPDASHHLDLMPSHPQDSDAIISARNMFKQNIRKWIQEFRTRENKLKENLDMSL